MILNKDDLNSLPKALENSQEGVVAKDKTFLNVSKVKSNLYVKNITIEDFKRHLIMTYGSFRAAASKAGIKEARLHQILTGYKVPQSPELIKRFSEYWNIDIVVLTQMFDNLRNRPEVCEGLTDEECKIITAKPSEEVKDGN